MEIKNVAVIGGGTMGNGIAHVFAMNGFDVNIVEIKQELADRAIGSINKNLDRQVKRELISKEDKDKILKRIIPVIGAENTPNDVDLVIEAIVEEKEVKLDLFNIL